MSEYSEATQANRPAFPGERTLVLHVDRDGCLTFVNDAALSFFRMPRDGVLNQSVFGTIVRDTAENRRDFEALFEGLAAHPGEYATNISDAAFRGDEQLVIAWTCVGVSDETGGGLREILCIGTDITESRHLETLVRMERDLGVKLSAASRLADALREVVRVARSITGWNAAGIYLVSPESDTLVLQYAEGFAGQDLGQLRRIHGESRHGRFMLSTGPMFAHGAAIPEPMREICQRVGVQSVAFLPFCDRGSAIGLMALGNETERQIPGPHQAILESIAARFGSALVRIQTDEARRHVEEFHAMLMETADQGFAIQSADGSITYVNSHLCSLLGYRRGDLIGRRAREFLAEGEEERLQGILREGPPYRSFEAVLAKKNGAEVRVAVSARICREKDGRYSGALMALSDIGGDRANEALLRIQERVEEDQKLSSLGVLAGGIAHDFNNLLTGVLTNASLALDSVPQDSLAATCLNEIQSSATRASEITAQLLAYAGKGRLIIEPLDLGGLVKEMASLLRAVIPKNATFRTETEPAIVDADALQARQVVMSLVNNAVEALGEQQGEFVVRTRQVNLDADHLAGMLAAPDAEPGAFAVLEVTDSGRGMSEETKAHMFEPFFSTKFPGRGLGLPAVLGAVHRHRGAVEVESVPGRGTAVRVYWPLSEREKERVPEPQSQREEASAGPCTILVVDDEAVVRSVAERTLEFYGYQVLLAENGQEGVDLYRQRSQDIRAVIMDLTMPVMDGEEALGEILRIREDARVIISTGYAEEETAERFRGNGAAAVLHKPYLASDLANVVKEVLQD